MLQIMEIQQIILITNTNIPDKPFEKQRNPEKKKKGKVLKLPQKASISKKLAHSHIHNPPLRY